MLLLVIIMVLFGLIRKIRGDQAKIKINKKVLKELGLDDKDNELQALLLENPNTGLTTLREDSQFQRFEKMYKKDEDKNQYEWFSLMWKMTDKDVKQVCGTDVALYLAYLRYCAILFLISMITPLKVIVSIFSCSTLLPLYVGVGERNETKLTSYLERLTLINVENSYSIIWVVFFFTVVYSMLGHIMIYIFEEKRKQLQVEFNEDPSELTDVEISMHSVLLKGINKQLPLGWVQNKMNELFLQNQNSNNQQRPSDLQQIEHFNTEYRFTDRISRKIINIHVVGDYMRMLHFLMKLDKNDRKKEFYEKLHKDKGIVVRKSFGSLCFKRSGAPMKDYCAQRPFIIKKQIQREKKRKEQSNFGIAFFTLSSTSAAQKLIANVKQLRRELKKQDKQLYYKLDANVKLQTQHKQKWRMELAPCPSDIIWANFNQKKAFRGCRVILLNIFLFLFTCILLNPSMVFTIIQPYIVDEMTKANPLEQLILNSIQPFIIFCYNYVFISTLVDWVSYFEEWESKSERHSNNLFKQFFFIIINSIFIPITQQENIATFLKFMMTKKFDEFQLGLSNNFLKSSEFFLRYLIQITFLTNIVQILDIPHYLYMGVKKLLRKAYSDEVQDDWYFDLGYHYAFAISVFIIIFVFSASVPLIPLFGFLFFAFKYIIDKYNFVFVYPSEFQSRGILAGSVSKYTAFGLFLFQLSMCGLFTSIFGKDFVIASIILVIGEIFYMVVFRFYNTNELKEAYLDILKEQGVDDANLFEPRLRMLTNIDMEQNLESNSNEKKLSDKHIMIMKDAYLHPYEKYDKQEKAKRQLNILLRKEIQKRVEDTQKELKDLMFNQEFQEQFMAFNNANNRVSRRTTRRSMSRYDILPEFQRRRSSIRNPRLSIISEKRGDGE